MRLQSSHHRQIEVGQTLSAKPVNMLISTSDFSQAGAIQTGNQRERFDRILTASSMLDLGGA